MSFGLRLSRVNHGGGETGMQELLLTAAEELQRNETSREMLTVTQESNDYYASKVIEDGNQIMPDMKSTSPMKGLMSSIRKRRTKLHGSTPSASKIKPQHHLNHSSAIKEFTTDLDHSEKQDQMCVDSEDDDNESGVTEAEDQYELKFEPPYHTQEESKVVQEITS